MRILDYKNRETLRNVLKLVKVLSSNHLSEEATWEADDDMRKRYPTIFNQGNCLVFSKF